MKLKLFLCTLYRAPHLAMSYLRPVASDPHEGAWDFTAASRDARFSLLLAQLIVYWLTRHCIDTRDLAQFLTSTACLRTLKTGKQKASIKYFTFQTYFLWKGTCACSGSFY